MIAHMMLHLTAAQDVNVRWSGNVCQWDIVGEAGHDELMIFRWVDEFTTKWRMGVMMGAASVTSNFSLK
jgi:hypothetical protein